VMSHELRTPLSAIIGYEELLADEITGPMNKEQKQQLSRIKASARHLLQLIDEILTYSRAEVGREAVDIETVPLQAVIDDAVALVAPMADDKGVTLTCSKLDGVTPIRTDAQKVRQIVVNLLSNAVKFTERGGAVSVTLTTSERRVTIAIRDSGIGIAGEFLDRIFEPFWQVEQKATRTAGGTGLGLSVSRRLARMLGGDIEVESAVGIGSTFTVTLPLDALNLAQSHPRVPTPTAPRPSLADAQASPRRAPASVESSASART
jgi:signal transduction histidine kinase